MLFLNAAAETDHILNPQGDVQSLVSAMKRLEKYIPINKSRVGHSRGGMNASAHPDLILRTACFDMFKPWETYFDMFVDEAKVTQIARLCGIVIKKKHTIVQPWPYKIGKKATKKEFDVLSASGTTGFERYMEFLRLDIHTDDVSTSTKDNMHDPSSSS